MIEDLSKFIFQDDQDSNHLAEATMNIIYDHFEERIESHDRDAEFVDICPAENILRFPKEKTREEKFGNFDSLVNFINSQ